MRSSKDEEVNDNNDDGILYHSFALEMDENGIVTTGNSEVEEFHENRTKHETGDDLVVNTMGDDEEEGVEVNQEERRGPDSPSSNRSPHRRSTSPRSWTNRSKPSPKREKLIQSLRGSRARSPPSSSATAAANNIVVATTTTNRSNNTSSPTVKSNHHHHHQQQQQSLLSSSSAPREFVQDKPSMPTDEEDTTENDIQTHDTNETNEQAYLSAEDTFSDDPNMNPDDDDDDETRRGGEEEENSSTDGHSSEWDVAVKKGKATVIGQAAKDFFSTLQPVFSATGVVLPALRQARHPSFGSDEDEQNNEQQDVEDSSSLILRHQLMTTPTHSKSITTSDDDEDEFSTPMMHYLGSHSVAPSYCSQNEGATDNDEEDEESNIAGRPSASDSKDESYEYSFEENGSLEEELDDDEEEEDDEDYEEEQQHTTPRARTTGATTSSARQRAKGSVVVRVQSSKSAEPEACLETREPESHPPTRQYNEEELSAGILPEVFINMRQKIEALSMFDSDILKYTANSTDEAREALKRSSQQSISAAILVTLTHKRYERRRLASIHIEQVVRSLITEHIEQQKLQQQKQTHQPFNSKGYSISRELERVRAILLLLSEDYVRSTNEDARKGGVLALGACAIGLKKADPSDPVIKECHDLILASVVHACQDQAPRVRYYSAESLMNIVRAVPALAVEHFFILYEVLRCLFADVNPVVRGGAVKYDKQLKMTIVGAMNAGTFAVKACVPVFARFVYVKNKATKQLTLTWLLELNEKLIGAPILEFLHIFMGGIIEMVADPSIAIRSSALAFLQSVLPKLLDVESSEAIDDFEEQATKVDFDKILQSLVTMMEHANPSVRKVAVYWMFKIVKAHMEVPVSKPEKPSAASISVRNSVPHVLPGILLSIGDTSTTVASGPSAKDEFLPDQTTQSLAEQTNACLQDAVSRDGKVFVEYLDGFIVALREELATSGGFSAKNPPAIERSSYRGDIPQDGTGIERPGWFRASRDVDAKNINAIASSRLCALQWVIVLYENVVPDQLKADYAREFVTAIIRQLVDKPPEKIVKKSLEVLAKITVPVLGEEVPRPTGPNPLAGLVSKTRQADLTDAQEFPMTESSISYALNILEADRRRLRSRDNEVFSSLVQLHSQHEELMADLSKVITYMCRLQPPEFVMVSFATELDKYIRQCRAKSHSTVVSNSLARELKFASSFVQHLNHVLLNAPEAEELRIILKDCIAFRDNTERHHQRSRLFFILLHSFSHNIAATISLCLWVGSYRTACLVLGQIDPLEITLVMLLEIDSLIEMLERPLFRLDEGSGAMLFQLFKSLLMIVPQSTSYCVLRDRLSSVARFRQSATKPPRKKPIAHDTKSFVARVTGTRKLHCECAWKTIRQESLEEMSRKENNHHGQPVEQPWNETSRGHWLGSQKEQTLVANNRPVDAMDSLQRPDRSHHRPSVAKTSSSVPKNRYDCDTEDETTILRVDTEQNIGSLANPTMVNGGDTNNNNTDVTKLAQEAVKEWKQFWVDSTTTLSTDRNE